MRSLFLLSIFVLGTAATIPSRSPVELPQDPLYLPNGKALELLSFGFRNALSNYLWMQTLSDFGLHYRSDRQYKWFRHQCELVTRLNPRSFEPFYLCSSLLAFEAKDPAGAIAMLDKAIIAQPNTWLFFYYRGFYRLYFNHDHLGAKSDFIEASKRPDANPIAARLASKSMSELDSPKSAIQFLTNAIRSARDDAARSALQGRLNELIYEENLKAIDAALEKVPAAKTVEELVAAGAYSGPLTDPFGGHYTIQGGKADSTSDKQRLSEYRGLKRNL
jgi:tetratricopeptide (TPR) repeat protein